MASWAENALTALERARQAQERHERRIDVQLRMEDAMTTQSGFWLVKVYAADDDTSAFAAWVISDKDEREAHAEAVTTVEEEFPNAADWTLTKV